MSDGKPTGEWSYVSQNNKENYGIPGWNSETNWGTAVAIKMISLCNIVFYILEMKKYDKAATG